MLAAGSDPRHKVIPMQFALRIRLRIHQQVWRLLRSPGTPDVSRHTCKLRHPTESNPCDRERLGLCFSARWTPGSVRHENRPLGRPIQLREMCLILYVSRYGRLGRHRDNRQSRRLRGLGLGAGENEVAQLVGDGDYLVRIHADVQQQADAFKACGLFNAD